MSPENFHITKHAIDRFRQRYKALCGHPAPFHVVRLLRSMLRSSRLKRVDVTEKKRGAAFFSNAGFEFVVVNGHVVTITIDLNKYRHLNAA